MRSRYSGLPGSRQPLADNMQREQRVGADFLDQHDQRRALACRGCDQFAALKQVIAILRNMVVAAVLVGALFHDRELAILRVLGHPIVEHACSTAMPITGCVVTSSTFSPLKKTERPSRNELLVLFWRS